MKTIENPVIRARFFASAASSAMGMLDLPFDAPEVKGLRDQITATLGIERMPALPRDLALWCLDEAEKALTAH